MTQTKKYWTVSLPLLLIISTSCFFIGTAYLFGKPWGYVLGFLFYHLVWCITIPLILLGKKGFLSLFKESDPLFSKKNWWLVTILALTILGAFGMGFTEKSPYSLLLLFLVTIPVTTLISAGEEVLWRGLFIKAFPDNIFLGIFYPTIGYALWHFAPQILYLDNSGQNPFTFVGFVFALGLCYALAAYKTGSCKWTAIAHSLSGIIALGAGLPAVILSLFLP